MFRIYPGALSPISGQAPKKLWRSMLTDRGLVRFSDDVLPPEQVNKTCEVIA